MVFCFATNNLYVVTMKVCCFANNHTQIHIENSIVDHTFCKQELFKMENPV